MFESKKTEANGVHGARCTCSEHPLPASMAVRDARDCYLAENGFTAADYDAKWTSATVFGLPIVVPNTPTHAWAIKLHDLHHVATGFGTDVVGEGEISVWEARGALRPLGAYTASIVAMGAALGWVLSPSRMSRAMRAPSARNLFDRSLDYASLLDMTVGELRTLLGMPLEGVAARRRSLHTRAPVNAVAV